LPAVVRGDIKPRSARTLAYLSQTLVQTIHLAEDEYINALGTDSWRRAVRNSVRRNSDYRNPSPSPQPLPDLAPQPAPAPQSTPSPHTPLPPTTTEFIQHVLAGRNLSGSNITAPSRPGRKTGEKSSPS
jgi:hypothetical protein